MDQETVTAFHRENQDSIEEEKQVSELHPRLAEVSDTSGSQERLIKQDDSDASGTRNGSNLAASPREPSVYFRGKCNQLGGRGEGHLQGSTQVSMNWGIWAPHGGGGCLGCTDTPHPRGVWGLMLYPPCCPEPEGTGGGRGSKPGEWVRRKQPLLGHPYQEPSAPLGFQPPL